MTAIRPSRCWQLSFLLLIGVTLIAEGLHFHVPKGYVYFAMAFSLGVELLNMKLRKKSPTPVKLHSALVADEAVVETKHPRCSRRACPPGNNLPAEERRASAKADPTC